MTQLKDLLDYLNLNKTQFAALCGVSENTVNKWLHGNNSPHWETIKKINQYFKDHEVPYSVFDIDF